MVLAVTARLGALVPEVRVTYQTFHGASGGARRRPGPQRRCLRAAGRCAGRPCRRTRTSPCGRRRWTRRPGRTRRRPRRWGEGRARSRRDPPGRRTGDQRLPTPGLRREHVARADMGAELGRQRRLPAYALDQWPLPWGSELIVEDLAAIPRTDTAMNCWTAAARYARTEHPPSAMCGASRCSLPRRGRPCARIIVGPCDWVVGPRTLFQPDLLVARRDEIGPNGPRASPLCWSSRRSRPTTRPFDLAAKAMAMRSRRRRLLAGAPIRRRRP